MKTKIVLAVVVAVVLIIGYVLSTAEVERGVERGYQIENIQGTNPNGESIELKSIKNKYVLIDFWASWCAPCRKLNPELVALYRNHNSQLEIFSISLDTDIDVWKNAIAKDQLTWPFHISELKGWEGQLNKTYQVESIPANILVDKNGVIVGKNLSAKEIIAFLK